MMAIPHLLVGAALGKATRRAWIACPAAFASHFVLDRLPHIDADDLAAVILRHDVGTIGPAAVDFLLGVGLVTWLLWGREGRGVMIAGAVCALLPDLFGFVPPFSTAFHWLPLAVAYDRVHEWCQGDVPSQLWFLGVAVQVAVATLAVVYLTRGKGREGGGE